CGITPSFDPRLGEFLVLSARRQPGKLRGAHEARRRVHEDEARRALGIRGSEEGCQRPSVADAAHDSALRLGRGQYCANVIHAYFECGVTVETIRHPGSALVED